MPKIILNGTTYAAGLDQKTFDKIGTDTLDTDAQDLSGAVNELNTSLSELDFITNPKVPLTSGTDLNTLTSNSIYQVGNWSLYTNAPTGIGYSGCLIVLVVRGYILQIAYSDNGKRHRFSYNGGSSWNAWV